MDGRIRSGTVVNASGYDGFARVVHGRRHEMRSRIRRIDEGFRLRKLYHALLQIAQRSFDQHLLLLVEVQ